MPIIVHRTVIPAGQYVGLPRKIGNANISKNQSKGCFFCAYPVF